MGAMDGTAVQEVLCCEADAGAAFSSVGAAVCGDGKSAAFMRMSDLLFFLRVSWVSLAGCGAGEEEVAFTGVAG